MGANMDTLKFIELKTALMWRLSKCHVDDNDEIIMYDRTLDTAIEFINFVTSGGTNERE